MCGIVGIIGRSEVAQRLFDGLRRLEYRGYDSAGIVTVQNGEFDRRRAEGKLDNLKRELDSDPLHGVVGIAHTRWATHGAPTVDNAHPHIAGKVALVHNGIIENFKPLRDELIADGRTFQSQTDSEVVAHLVAREVERGATPEEAVSTVLPRLHGAFAIAFLFADHPDLIIGARMGAPLTVGYGEGENYLGSDALALAPLTQRIAYLDEGDWAVVKRDSIRIFDRANRPVERPIVTSGASAETIDKGNHAHFMRKEIFEQPIVVAQTLQSYVRPFEGKVALPDIDFNLGSVNRVTIVACGTSYYAGMVAKYWFEQFARVPVDIDVASEFRYREPVLEPGAQLATLVNPGGNGRCAITLDPKRRLPGQAPYQGVVALHGDQREPLQRIAQVLEHYMLQSEQLDTRLVLAANGEVAAGLLIQRMPMQGEGNLAQRRNEDDIGLSEAYNRIGLLAATLTQEELLTLTPDQVLHRLFWEETVRRFDPLLPKFACTCSRERVMNMLRTLGREESDSLIKERGEVEVGCEFCGLKYHFDAVDVG
ncbi:MAG: glutamine--fructose-6-phosphate transaminase (isomerizing), partial [Sphingomicrobium sp.]